MLAALFFDITQRWQIVTFFFIEEWLFPGFFLKMLVAICYKHGVLIAYTLMLHGVTTFFQFRRIGFFFFSHTSVSSKESLENSRTSLRYGLYPFELCCRN